MFNSSSQVLTTIAQGFLFLSNEYFIIGLISIGYLIIKPEIFGRALFILLFTMILNTFLKSIWQIPLPSHLGTGFSFPSGHMQSAIVLWGWLAWEFKNSRFTSVALLILCGIAFGLLYLEYHRPIDIAGAVFFGVITLLAYYHILKINWIQKNLPFMGLIFVGLSIPIIGFLANYPPAIGTAEGALIGFSLGWAYQNKYCRALDSSTKALKEKLILSLVAVSGVLIIKLSCATLLLNFPKTLSLFCSTLLIALWISAGTIKTYRQFMSVKR